MSVDLEAMTRIHRIENEIDDAIKAVKTLSDQYIILIEDLNEYKELVDALTAVKVARTKLKIAICDNRELNRAEVDISEAKFHKCDLSEILSHYLVVYTQDTGRDVIRERFARTRHIDFKAKYGKPTLDQERLPLGINKHLGEHITIPDDRRIEMKAGEVER